MYRYSQCTSRPLTCGRGINWIIIKKLHPNILYAERLADEKASIAFPISSRTTSGIWAPGILRMETFPSTLAHGRVQTRGLNPIRTIFTLLLQSRRKNREGEKKKSVYTSNFYHNVNCLHRFSERECQAEKLFWTRVNLAVCNRKYSWIYSDFNCARTHDKHDLEVWKLGIDEFTGFIFPLNWNSRFLCSNQS